QSYIMLQLASPHQFLLVGEQLKEQGSQERNTEFISNRYVHIIIWMPEAITKKQISANSTHPLVGVQQTKERPPDGNIHMQHGIHLRTTMYFYSITLQLLQSCKHSK